MFTNKEKAMNLKKFDGAKFPEYRIVKFNDELYQVHDIQKNTRPMEDIYRLSKLAHEWGKPEYDTAKESEITDYTQKLRYIVQVKGYFPTIVKDYLLNKKYADLKMGYGSDTLFCTQDEWKELKSEYFKDETYFKVIGIHIIELSEDELKRING